MDNRRGSALGIDQQTAGRTSTAPAPPEIGRGRRRRRPSRAAPPLPYLDHDRAGGRALAARLDAEAR
jgi:hypothetical protein